MAKKPPQPDLSGPSHAEKDILLLTLVARLDALGMLAHDCWAPYWKLDDGAHALCNAHLLRELVYVRELTGQAWPLAMKALLLDARQLTEAARLQRRPLDADTVAAFAMVYDDIVR